MSSLPPDDPDFEFLGCDRKKLLKEMKGTYDSKKNCWVPDAKLGYVKGEVQSTEGDKVTVKTEHGQTVTLKKDQIGQMNPPKFECLDDMANLTFLNDASVLGNLRARYARTLIYTFSGLFCIAINPYRRLPIYTMRVVQKWRHKKKTEVPPHLFTITEVAFQQMVTDRENQSILITGESGAGKTENTKKVIQYFAFVAAAGKGEPKENEVSLEDQIVQTNPVLEAYGNAKTVRNNNSSRFGKFIRIHFSPNGMIACADIEHYLLEKARVTAQGSIERNYHIFYQLNSSAYPDYHSKFLISGNSGDYAFINQGVLTVDGIDDVEEMKVTDNAFDVLGFTEDEKFSMYKITCAIMNFGEMRFKQKPRDEQAETDGTGEAEKTAQLLGINAADLLKALLTPKIKVGTETVVKAQTLPQVMYSVSAMSKSLFDKMFTWLVQRCNKTLETKERRQYFIGVLDIAGFEIFEFNSFEQLCINYTNERLQQFFNHHMFVLEQEIYKKEGIDWDFIDFGMDLAACIELIEKPMGILSMLEEECIVPKATDDTYKEKLYANHLGKNKTFGKPTKPSRDKSKESHFALFHYAGVVNYSVAGWLEKNKDPVNDNVVQLLQASKVPLIASVYEAPPEAAGGGKKKKGGAFQTISSTHRQSLGKLMTNLYTTQPHFVRCIIPNELKQPGMIDAALVLHQLQCNGVLEGIRICRKGFPTRLLYSDFKQRYSILAAYAIPSGFVDGKVVSDKILTALEVDKNDFRLGTTKLFFRAGVLAQLEDLRDERLSRIIAMLQSWIRGYMMRSEYKGLCDQRKGLSVIQRNIRTWVSIKGWKWWDLWCKIKPLLKSTQAADEMKIKEKEYIETKEAMKNMEAARKELEGANVDLLQAKNDCTLQLQAQEETIQEAQDRVVQLVKQRADFEHQMKDLEARLSDEEETASLLEDFKRKLEVESKTYRADIEERSQALAKAEEETKAKNHQIATLQGELSNQDGHLDKMSKEKKKMDEDNKKLHDDLVGEEDKANHLNKLKKKLEDALDELEDNLSREKKGRSDVEKVKRKLEQDLKATQETVDELDRIKRDLEESMKRKDVEINDISSRLEDEQGIIAQCQKKIRELQARVEELEEELEAERGARSKSEKQRAQLGRELDELAESLDEAGGATSAQIELNKKREGEILKLRNDYEEANVSHEAQISALRKKQQDAESELSEQVDQLQKNKSRVEKDKNALKGEIDDLQAQIDGVSKGKGNAEKMAKTLESKLNEASHQVDDANRSIAEINSRTTRTSQEVADLGVQLEDAESTIGSLSKQKAKLASDLEEVKRSFEDESRARMKLSTEVRNLQADIDTLRDQIEEEQESKSDLQRLLQKAQSDAQAWKSKFETGGGASAEEFEELKRRLGGRLAESESSLEAAQSKISSLEKIKYRLAGELEDLMVDVERANSNAGQLEKRQHQFDKSIDEWKHKARDIEAELEQSNREARGFSSEVFRLKAQLEESHDSINAVRRENKNLSEEIHELTEQLSEGGRSVHEVEKARKRLEIEREELQSALEEAEAALETEEAKVLRAQLELGQIRQEIDRRLAEKDEEFDNTRRNHQRSLESVQASLEAESKGRSDAIRSKKKLESDINELEVALDTANRVKIDAEKNVKKFQEQLRLISVQVEEETRNYQDAREQYQISERRNNMLASEAEELRTTVESAQRSYKLAESELHEANDRINELTSQNSSIAATRRKLESDIGSIATDLDDQATEIKNAEEKARKAAADAARLAEELRTEQEHSVHIEKMRKVLENQFRDLSVRLEEAEAASFKGGKRVLAKLESRVRELEAELDSEQRRHQEVLKNQRKSDRRLQELAFTADEDRKNQERLTDLIDKINGKIKTYKRQVEEAEEIAAVNLAKYRKVQTELEEAEERADQSEQSVAKLRAKNRSSVSMSRSGEESFSSSGTTTVIKRRTVVRTSSGIE